MEHLRLEGSPSREAADDEIDAEEDVEKNLNNVEDPNVNDTT